MGGQAFSEFTLIMTVFALFVRAGRIHRLPSTILVCLTLSAMPAVAQRANDNALGAAEDAFGTTVGNETIGLYDARNARGFSPQSSGNVRIEGLYFDRPQSGPGDVMVDRLTCPPSAFDRQSGMNC